MAASAHLTLAAPANEKFTVQSAPARLPRRKASLQAQDQAMDPTYDCQAPKPFRAGKHGRKGVSDRLIAPVGAPVAVEAAVVAAA